MNEYIGAGGWRH